MATRGWCAARWGATTCAAAETHNDDDGNDCDGDDDHDYRCDHADQASEHLGPRIAPPEICHMAIVNCVLSPSLADDPRLEQRPTAEISRIAAHPEKFTPVIVL